MQSARQAGAAFTGALMLLALLGPAPPARAQSFTGLGDLGGVISQSTAWGVSGDGLVVVGQSISTSGAEAFRWVAPSGPMTGLGDLAGGGFESSALGVNQDGSIVVGRGTTATGVEAMRYDVGTSTMSSIASADSAAFGVSDDGSVAVGCFDCNNTAPTGATAFAWDSTSGVTSLSSALGAAPHIAFAVSGDGRFAVGGDLAAGSFRVEIPTLTATLTPPPPPDLFAGQGVSRDGYTVVGGSVFGLDAALEADAFRWMVGAGSAPLGTLPGSVTTGQASDASSDGLIIVGATSQSVATTSVAVEAFVWDPANGARSVKDVLTGLGVTAVTDWTLVHATAISDDGQIIVGWGTNPSGDTEAWIAEIPRPDFATTSVASGTPPPASLLGGPTTQGGIEVLFANGTGGGTLAASYNEVPPGTLPTVTPGVSLFQVPSDPLQLWDIEYTGSCTAPVEVTFGYDDATLSVPEPTLEVMRYDPTLPGWTTLTKLDQDTTANTITVESPCFSLFALGSAPAQAPALAPRGAVLLAAVVATAGSLVLWGRPQRRRAP